MLILWSSAIFATYVTLQCPVTCGKGTQHRQVWCQANDEQLEDVFCHQNSMPESVRSCELNECAAWHVGPWGAVSTHTFFQLLRILLRAKHHSMFGHNSGWSFCKPTHLPYGRCRELTTSFPSVTVPIQITSCNIWESKFSTSAML